MKKEKCQAINKEEDSKCILNKGHQGAQNILQRATTVGQTGSNAWGDAE